MTYLFPIFMHILKSACLITGLLLLRLLAWKLISRRLQYMLWLTVAIFLFANSSIRISSSFSMETVSSALLNQIKESRLQTQEEIPAPLPKETAEPVSDFQASPATTQADAPAVTTPAPKQTAEPLQPQPEARIQEKPPLTGKAFPLTANTIGLFLSRALKISTFAVFFALLIWNMRFYLLCKRNRRFLKKTGDGKLNVYVLEGIRSPFLFGLGIYVAEEYEDVEGMLSDIIAHEICHYKSLDNIWSAVRLTCLAFNWYNPFLWIANEYVKRDCELSCDEAATKNMSAKEKLAYGKHLLTLASISKDRAAYPTIATTNMSISMKRYHERISRISAKRKPHRLATALVILLASLLFGFVFFKQSPKEVQAVTAANADGDGGNAIADSAEAGSALRAGNTPDKTAVGTEKAPNDNMGNNGTATALSHDANAADESSDQTANATDTDTSDEFATISRREGGRVDTYYNKSACSYGGFTYLTSPNGLFKIDEVSGEWTKLYDKPTGLGTIAEGYLFFYSYPAENISNMDEELDQASIMALNLNTDDIIVSKIVGKDIYQYQYMHYKNGRILVYVYFQDSLLSFSIKNGSLEHEAIEPTNVPNNLNGFEPRYILNIPASEEGYTGLFYRQKGIDIFSKVIYVDKQNTYELKENLKPEMITYKGIICSDEDFNLYLWSVKDSQINTLYNSIEHENMHFYCYAYDKTGVYGILDLANGNYYISRLNWDGSLNKLFFIEAVENNRYYCNAQISVIDDWIYFYNSITHKMERQNLNNLNQMETETE